MIILCTFFSKAKWRGNNTKAVPGLSTSPHHPLPKMDLEEMFLHKKTIDTHFSSLPHLLGGKYPLRKSLLHSFKIFRRKLKKKKLRKFFLKMKNPNTDK